jgi:hypothetical protein
MADRITVSSTPLPTAIASALRTVVGLVGSYLVGAGYVQADKLDGLVTITVTGATIAYGLYRAYENRRKLIVTAEAAPDSVATVV